MFRLYKLKSDKSRLRIDFNFLNLQASQVPKGWDKLFVSVISVETGKIITKSGKTTVKNGKCRWSETLSESLNIVVGETKQDADQCLIKLVLATGPNKSSVLGEVTVNLIDHISTKASSLLSLPLQKCIYGTVLHVKVQCISPRTSQRNESSTDDVLNAGDLNTDCDDMENKSDVSDTCFTKSVGSSSSNCFDSSYHLEDGESRDTMVTVSGSRNSFESLDDSVGKGNSSPCSNFSGHTDDTLGRQDSTDSQSTSPYALSSTSEPPKTNWSSLNSKVLDSRGQSLNQADDFGQPSTVGSSYVLNTGSSKDVLEVVDGLHEDFRVQAKKWERNARRLSAELERLSIKFGEQSKKQELLDLDLVTSKTQCEGLKQENEQLKNMLEEIKQKSMETSNSHSKNFQKQLEDELRCYKESNAKLAVQLEKTQESNVELVSILQELEETIEKQKEEISSKQDEITVYKNMCESSTCIVQDSPENRQSAEAAGNQLLARDLHTNSNHIEKSGQLDEPQEKLLDTISDLERSLEDLKNELESEKSSKTQVLLDCERKWRSKLVAKEEEIINLEEKLSEAMLTQHSNKKNIESTEDCYPTTEIQALKDKVLELEHDCNELTDENLELLIKLKRAESALQNSTLSNSLPTLEESEVSYHNKLEKESGDGKREILIKQNGSQSEDNYRILEEKCKDLELQLLASLDRISNLEDALLKSKTKEEELAVELASAHEKHHHQIESNSNNHPDTGSLGASADVSSYDHNKGLTTSSMDYKDDNDSGKQKEAYGQISSVKPVVPYESDVAEEKRVLEDSKDTVIKETSLMSESLDSSDCKSLYGSFNSQDSVSEVLHRISSELESGNHDLELQVSELEKENVQLSERISGMEAQLRYLTDEKEASRLELQQSCSRVTLLQDEIKRLQTEMETQRNDMNQKFLDMQQRWSEAQEECEYLKIVNPKLQATTESVIDECGLLQRTNRDLRSQNLELHEHCAHLKAGLRDSENTYSQCIVKIETLVADFSSLIEEISMKTRGFNSEVDTLFHENEKLKGQLLSEESQFFHEYLEKQAEVENLETEVRYLSEQLCKAHNGEQTSSEAAMEMSKLYANNAKLEAAHLEGQEKLKRFKHKYDTLEIAFETMKAELSDSLAGSNKKYEVLLVEHEKIQGSLGDAKSSEQKAKSTVYALDLKLQASEYERLQLVEEIESLKHQVLKLPELQTEVSALKSSLNEAKFANGRLEASFQLIYQDHEELKSEKTSLVQKILSMQMLESELEDCRNSKIALQEKLLRLEGDLTAREAECAEDVKLKHELGRMRRTNSQLQRKIKDFEVDKDEFLKTILDVEGTPNQKKLRHVASDLGGRYGRPRRRTISNSSISEDSEFSEMNNGQHFTANKSLAVEIDSETPESKFIEMTRCIDMKRAKYDSHPPDIQTSAEVVASKESKEEEEYKQKTLKLEAELKDLHNRYFNMSLKYAEIETEREELSIKLNASQEGRTWFSYKP